MKTLLALALLFFSFLSASSQAQGLQYQWKPGAIYRFKTVQNDKIDMGGGGMMGMMAMAGTMEFRTESVFSLRIDKVFPNGSASGSFFLQFFRVTDTRGNTMASLRDIPKNAIEADFTVDKKGNFTFTETPILLCRENGNLLVTTKIDKGEMAASAEAGGEKVTLFAEFNPKTGTLKAGYSTSTIAKPKPKPVTVKEDDETIDLLPTQFLDLLVLPEGMIAEGQVLKTRMYDTEVTEKVEDFTGNVATLNFTIASSLNARKFEKDAMKMAGDEDEDVKKDEMDGIEEEGLMPGMNGGGTPEMGQEMNGNIRLIFDNGIGMIKEMTGTIDSKTNMMGMEIKQNSKVKMTPVP